MTVDRLSLTLGALADPTRRAILARLAKGGASVTEIAKPFDMSLPAVSKHLKVLERAGLVTRGKEAQWRPASSAAGRHCASLPRVTSPARSSTLRCLLTAGRLMSKGFAISVTDAPPFARRARIARRVGSARAPSVRLRRSTVMWLLGFI